MDTVYKSESERFWCCGKCWEWGGAPYKDRKARREGLGDRKSTGRKWPLPNFPPHGSEVGGEIEIAGQKG